MAALRPVRERLAGPLSNAFRDRHRPDDARTAAGILADYAADQPELLAELLLEADERQWAALWPRLPAHRVRAIPLMERELQREMPPEDQAAARDQLARRQAQAGVALLRLGQEDSVWPLFRHSPDPSRRTYLLHRLGPLGTDPRVLIRRLAEEPDVSARRALILALGEFTPEQLLPEARQPLTDTLLAWYRDDPDPGTHTAIDWLLRHPKEGDVPRKLDWRQAEALRGIDAELQGRPPDARRRWYVNGQGQTMVMLPGPVEFRMGSPAWEQDRRPDEVQHLRKIPRSYALAARPVTMAEFERFVEARPEIRKEFYKDSQVAPYLKQYSPAADGPVVFVTWYMAAAYCNWLSQQEGIPEAEWVYPPGPSAIRPGMTMAAAYLERTGYRLPTEAEWEYACRAGAGTSRYFGGSEEMLPRYAWYSQNSHGHAWPVGQKKPNDFGLFDMQGSVWVWCQDRYGPYPEVGADQALEDREDKENKDAEHRSLRGGAFYYNAVFVRSGLRNWDVPSFRINYFGFRLARTYR
jgi:formylglycine-generating enzyme required for sulfatase activity